MKFAIQTAPRNGKLAGLIDEAVKAAVTAWLCETEDALEYIIGECGVEPDRIHREAETKRGPEESIFVDNERVFHQTLHHAAGSMRICPAWTQGWEERAGVKR